MVLALGALAARWRMDASSRRALVGILLWLGTPLAVAGALLGAYNLARFGSWTESGIGLQLTQMKFGWDLRYLFANGYSYLLRAPELSCRFPYVIAPWSPGGAFPAGYAPPAGYEVSEPLAGILVSAPWSWLGIAAAVALAARLLRRPTRRPWRPPEAYATAAFAVLATLPSLALVGLWRGSMRYLADVSSGFLLLASVGAWTLLETS